MRLHATRLRAWRVTPIRGQPTNNVLHASFNPARCAQREPRNIIEHRWERNGLQCQIIFVCCSYRCGYVAVPIGHWAYGIDIDEADALLQVHGGVTFAQKGNNNDEFYPGDEFWWIGFDCAHAGDATTETLSVSSYFDLHFWILGEVVRETDYLANQLAL